MTSFAPKESDIFDIVLHMVASYYGQYTLGDGEFLGMTVISLNVQYWTILFWTTVPINEL